MKRQIIFFVLLFVSFLAYSNEDSRNYYEILNVSQDASSADIRKAYIRAMRENHPDKVEARHKGTSFDSEEERQRRLQQDYEKANREASLIRDAYDILKNEETRRSYDRSLRDGTTFESNTRSEFSFEERFNYKDGDIRRFEFHDWKFNLVEGEITFKQYDGKSKTLEGLFWAIEKADRRLVLFQNSQGTFTFESMGAESFLVQTLGVQNNIFDFVKNLMGKLTPSTGGMIVAGNSAHSTGTTLLEELFSPKLSRQKVTPLTIGSLESFTVQAQRGQQTTSFSDPFLLENGEVSENRPESRTQSENRTENESRTQYASGERSSQNFSRNSEIAEFSPANINTLEKSVRLLLETMPVYDSPGYKSQMFQTVKRFPKEVLMFYAVQWVVLTAFSNDSNPFVQADLVDMLTDPIGIMSFGAFVMAANTAGYVMNKGTMALRKYYNTLVLELSKELHRTGNINVPRFKKNFAGLLKGVAGVASVSTLPVTLSAGMMASQALHEWLIDANVKACNEGFGSNSNRNFDHLAVCEKAFNDWTTGYKAYRYSSDVDELILAAYASHAFTALVTQGATRLSFIERLKNSKWFQRLASHRFVRAANPWVMFALNIGSFLVAIELISDTKIRRNERKGDIEDLIRKDEKKLTQILHQVKNNTEVPSNCIFTEEDMNQNHDHYKDFFEQSNPNKFVVFRPIKKFFMEMLFSYEDSFAGHCPGFEAKNILSYYSSHNEELRGIEMEEFSMNSFSWFKNTAQSVYSYTMSTDVFKQVLDLQEQQQDFSYPLYFKGIEDVNDYDSLVQDRIRSVMSLNIWNNFRQSLAKEAVKEKISTDSENFYIRQVLRIDSPEKLDILFFLFNELQNCESFDQNSPCEQYLGSAVQLLRHNTNLPAPSSNPHAPSNTYPYEYLETDFEEIRTALVCGTAESCEEADSLNAFTNHLMYVVGTQNYNFSETIQGNRDSRHSFSNLYDNYGDASAFVEQAVYNMVCSDINLKLPQPQDLNCELNPENEEDEACTLEHVYSDNLLPSYHTHSVFAGLSLGVTSFEAPALVPAVSSCQNDSFLGFELKKNFKAAFYQEVEHEGQTYPNLLAYLIAHNQRNLEWWEDKAAFQHLFLFQVFRNEYRKLLLESYLPHIESVMDLYAKQINYFLDLLGQFNVGGDLVNLTEDYLQNFQGSDLQVAVLSQQFEQQADQEENSFLKKIQTHILNFNKFAHILDPETAKLATGFSENINEIDAITEQAQGQINEIKKGFVSVIKENVSKDSGFKDRLQNHGMFLLQEDEILDEISESMFQEDVYEFVVEKLDRMLSEDPAQPALTQYLTEEEREKFLGENNLIKQVDWDDYINLIFRRMFNETYDQMLSAGLNSYDYSVLQDRFLDFYISNCVKSQNSPYSGTCNLTVFNPQDVFLISLAQQIISTLESALNKINEYHFLFNDTSLR